MRCRVRRFPEVTCLQTGVAGQTQWPGLRSVHSPMALPTWLRPQEAEPIEVGSTKAALGVNRAGLLGRKSHLKVENMGDLKPLELEATV